MKRNPVTGEQIIGILNEHEAGTPVSELGRKNGVSDASIWTPRFTPSLALTGMALGPPSRLAAIFELLIAALPPRAGRRSSRGGTLSFVEDVSEHVVGDVGHADLHLGPSNPDGPDELLHLVLLPSKDMLDRGPDLGSSPVCPRHRFRHCLAFRLSLVDVRLQAIVF